MNTFRAAQYLPGHPFWPHFHKQIRFKQGLFVRIHPSERDYWAQE